MPKQFVIPWTLNDIFSLMKGREQLFVKGLHGLEKESLRVDKHGNLALTPHPKALGNKLTDPYITTDFSESQPEFITPPCEKIEDAVAFLEKLHRFSYSRLGDELLWPGSMPARLPAEKEIPIAHFGDSPEGMSKEIYRRGLALRYGKYMQTICGVHYNMSLSDGFWDVLYENYGKKMSRKGFINEVSMNLVRNFIRYRWLLVFLFGASPYKDQSYGCRLMAKDKEHTISLRSSRCGYTNPAKLPVTYNNFNQHLADLNFCINTVHSPYTDLGLEDHGVPVQLNDHILQAGDEYYFSIRLKPPKPYDDVLKALKRDGVEYFEVRIFDVNPFEYSGVNVRQLYFAHLFMVNLLLAKSQLVDDQVLETGLANVQDVALFGRNSDLKLKRDGKKVLMREWIQEILTELKPLAQMMDKSLKTPMYVPALKYFVKETENPVNLPAFRIARESREQELDFIEFGLKQARKWRMKNGK